MSHKSKAAHYRPSGKMSFREWKDKVDCLSRGVNVAVLNLREYYLNGASPEDTVEDAAEFAEAQELNSARVAGFWDMQDNGELE